MTDMPLQNVLFSSNGRIGPRSFWRGVIILVGVQVILALVSALVLTPPLLFAIAFNVALLWAYACVYAKRFHDSGRSGSWFIGALVAYIVLSTILSMFAVTTVLPEVVEAFGTFAEATSPQDQRIAAEILNTVMAENMNTMSIISLVITFVANFLIGLPVAKLRGDAGENRFGPPEGESFA